MKKEKSIELLNKALNEELTSVHQYMYFHFRLHDLGYDMLASLFKRVSIIEMMHSEQLAERILFLDGEVNMLTTPPQKIHEVKEMIIKSIELETTSVDDYNKWAKECGDNLDSATKKLFENLVDQEENHLDTFQTELDNLIRFKDNYLALQSLERTKEVALGEKKD